MKRKTQLPFIREDLEREVETFTKPFDLDLLISKGLISKRGAWYYAPNMRDLPDYVRKKMSQMKTAPDGKALVKFYSASSIARTAAKMARAGYLKPSKAMAAQKRVIVTGAQMDAVSNKWYFIVWADEARKRVKFKGDPVFDQETDAHAAAQDWLMRSVQPSNFNWGTRNRRPTRRK